MPIQIPSRSVLSLSTGAALAACPLAAAALPPLNFGTLDSANGVINLGSTTGTFSYTGPSSSMAVNLNVAAGSGTGIAIACAYNVPGYTLDYFAAGLSTSNAYTAGVWTVTFVLTLNQAVYFTDLSLVGATATANWLMDSAAISNGDLVSIGQHTFSGTFIYGGGPQNSLAMGFGLYLPTAAVPLPGAAGLAAIGLVGMSRRRRR